MGVKDLEDLKKLSMIRSQINEHTVEEIMHTDYPTVGPEDRVSDVLSKMRETGYQEIPVMEGGEYLGMVSYGVILRRKSISLDTKVKTLVRNIPSVSRDTDMTKVAEIVIATNCRQL
ncbi:MAG: CBS domain-containing protein, partial [Thermoplasmatales archaeon]|nr:CBS domain-containing protein [Thermoplasmatales archaeon]